jgi:hypothetical protein
VLLQSRLSYPVSSYTGASMSHVWHMDTEVCSSSVPGIAGCRDEEFSSSVRAAL